MLPMPNVKCFAAFWKQARYPEEVHLPKPTGTHLDCQTQPLPLLRQARGSKDKKQEIPVPSPTAALLH